MKSEFHFVFLATLDWMLRLRSKSVLWIMGRLNILGMSNNGVKMRSIILVVVCLCVGSFGGNSLFREPNDGTNFLKTNEKKGYEKIKKARGVLHTNIVSVDMDALSQKKIRVDLFDGESMEADIVEGDQDGFWKGKGKGFDRFVVRRFGGRFSGHILFKGRQYVLIPIGDSISALVEQSLTGLSCGNRGEAPK